MDRTKFVTGEINSMLFRQTALAAVFVVGVFCAGGAMAAPISSAGTIALETTAEFVQWHQPHRRQVGPRHRRCWWENRRVRDHRGRWVVRRVQVCR